MGSVAGTRKVLVAEQMMAGQVHWTYTLPCAWVGHVGYLIKPKLISQFIHQINCPREQDLEELGQKIDKELTGVVG